MAELKNVFSKAIMNKDMDERLIPDGQYRDALNIQIATSDGSDVGSVQTLLGNAKHNSMAAATGVYDVADNSTCVASISAVDRDKIYYFIDAGTLSDAGGYNSTRKDYILEYNALTKKHKYVFVDIYSVKTTVYANITNSSEVQVDLGASNSTDITGIRKDMWVEGTFTNHTGDTITILNKTVANGATYNVTEADKVLVTGLGYSDSKRTYNLSKSLTISDGDDITFKAPRVLNFSKHVIITGINILEDSIYWTDNNTEPKKINIPRCIAGTGGVVDVIANNEGNIFIGDTPYFHTRLVVEDESDNLKVAHGVYDDLGVDDDITPVYVDESHVTVIKKAPTQPLELEMYRTNASRVDSDGVENPAYTTISSHTFSDEDTQSISFDTLMDFREGDVLLFVNTGDTELPTTFTSYDVRAKVIASNVQGPNNLFSTGFELSILSATPNVVGITQDYHVRLEQADPLFEFKLPRFSYRYKYQDGEYSTFAPWSRIAFLPAPYEYLPKKGYNFGMVNQIRSLLLKGYHGDKYSMPKDVVEIDLLYKETNNPTVYTVKTAKQSDKTPIWPNLEGKAPLHLGRGEYELETDMVHAVVPSNQLLRPWDNVPRKALAQEISANRLIYGNYVQNYTVTKDPIIAVGLVSDKLSDVTSDPALPSVKSLRTYQVGVVFSDGYGRETPVLTHEKSSIRVPKKVCGRRNRLDCRLKSSTDIPSWAKYYTYYIKETSIDYHTLSMDRWYDAWDGNIWLSFPSSDRNKIDEETFLELKKAHGSETEVKENARYKVLAIESEAPDFIKMDKDSIGTVFNNDEQIGNSNYGFPVLDGSAITIEETAFNNSFGADFLLDTPENMSLIFYGGGEQSKEYAISKIALDGSVYKITLKDKLGVDILFTSTDNSFASSIDDLRVTLFEGKVKNKPEFDGRFFVKIYKDTLLESYVLTYNPQQWVVSDQWSLSYLHNNGYATNSVTSDGAAKLGSYMKVNSGSSDYSGQGLPQHPTEWPHHVDTEGGDIYRWGGASSDTSTSSEAWQVTTNDINKNPILAINDEQAGGFGAAEEFWEGMRGAGNFFIDCGTVFSYSGKNTNRPGRFGCGSLNSNQWDGWTDNGDDDAEDDGGIGEYYLGNSVSGKGQPSRGIWETNPTKSFMDISWSTFTSTYDGSGNLPDDTDITYRLQDFTETGNPEKFKAWKFIEQLTTPGTRFRFTRDPDKVLYKVTDRPHPTGGVYPASSDDGEAPMSFADSGGTDPNNYNIVYGWYPDYEGDWVSYQNTIGMEQGYNSGVYDAGSTRYTGVYGIRNYKGSGNNSQFEKYNFRQRWTICVEPGIGMGPDSLSGYNPIRGTKPANEGGPDSDHDDYRRALQHDGAGNGGEVLPGMSKTDHIQIMAPFFDSTVDSGNFTDNPAVWETEPKESVELDIYYQASGLIPLDLNINTNEELLPIGSTFTLSLQDGSVTGENAVSLGDNKFTITEWDQYNRIKFTPAIPEYYAVDANQLVVFTKRDNYSLTLKLVGGLQGAGSANPTDSLRVRGERSDFDTSIHNRGHVLDWNNCWTFGNGVESDRIRDDYNAPQMDNGVKASTVIAEPVQEERRKHGLIWSGIYNSTVGVNNTNQFIMAEAITKDLNPSYGSIQALLNRDTRLVMFCEDKILRAQTNKDALYNADGKPQVVASNAVVGDVTPYQGDWGISTNPESMVATPTQVYFTDAIRGQVLAISGEGVRSISKLGMRDYFSDKMRSTDSSTPDYVWRALGTHDEKKGEYNLTISKKLTETQETGHDATTISYSERSKGWVSFKSFIPQSGLSINNSYYTFDKGHIYEHDDESVDRNNFYGSPYNSDITTIFNKTPNTVKNFTTINYEGTQARVTAFDTESVDWYNGDYSEGVGGITTANSYDGEYFNLESKTGWYVDNIATNLQTCGEIEFIEKEGKWFGTPTGEAMGDGDSDILLNNKGDMTAQGIGSATMTHSDSGYTGLVTINVSSANFSAWDTTAVSTTEAGLFTSSVTSFVKLGGEQIDEGGEIVEFTVSPVGNYPLHAENLLIEGATANGNVYTNEGSANVGATGANQYQGDIDTITFSDNGTPGDPGNTVKVAVKFKGGEAWPESNVSYGVDIDIKAGTPTEPQRKTCLLSLYARNEDLQLSPDVENVAGDDILETVLIADAPLYEGSVQSGPVNQHSGTVPDGVTSEVARIKFERIAPHYYGQVSVKWENLGEYSGCYTHSIDEVTTSGLKTEFTVHLYYTPPQNGGLINDPEDFCGLGHRAIIVHDIITPDLPPGDGPDGEDAGFISVVKVSPNSYDSQGGSGKIEVYGDIGSNYNLHLQKKISVDSGVTASTYGYYNFVTDAFQTETTFIQGAIPNTGVSYHDIMIPRVVVKTRYDVTIDGGPIDGATTVISDQCPTQPGDLSIIQRGIKTATIDVKPYDHAGNASVEDTVIRSSLKDGGGSFGNFTEERANVQGTQAVSSTRLVLKYIPKNVVAGMYVINPFGQTQSDFNAIKHLTKVVRVERNIVTISNALEVALADGDQVHFISNNASVKPFEVKVTKAGGENDITAIQTGVEWKDMVGGLKTKSITVDGNTSDTVNVTVTGNTRSLLPNQKVTGNGIVGSGLEDYTFLKGTSSSSVIQLSSPQSLTDGTVLTFSENTQTRDLDAGIEAGGVETGIKLLHIQAHVSAVNTEAKIQGYLRVNNIKYDTTLRIYSDDILNQT